MSNFLGVNQTFLRNNAFTEDFTGNWFRDGIVISREQVEQMVDSVFKTMVENLIIKNDKHE